MPKRFAIVPSWVASRTDGDHHYINAPQLMALWGVNPAECVIVRDPVDRLGHPPLITLSVDYWGRYDLEAKLS